VLRRRIALGLAAALVSLVAAGAALAGPDDKVLYRFVGQLQSPANGTALTISVQRGNHHALRAMLGQSQVQTFQTAADTTFLRWSNGIPTVVRITDLAAGDWLAINVRTPRSTPLAQVVQSPARIVGDHGPTWQAPDKPLYLFRGTVVQAGGSALSVQVSGGNPRALRLLVGQSATQTFTTDAETVFLRWQNRIPTVVDITSLAPGDRVVVRVRADRGADLGTVLAAPAKRVAEREPRSEEQKQSEQA